MFFVLSDSSLVGVYLGVIYEDCEIDLHKFHRILPQLPIVLLLTENIQEPRIMTAYNENITAYKEKKHRL